MVLFNFLLVTFLCIVEIRVHRIFSICCTAPAQKCFVCNNGKKNSDCTKIETCKKDEEVSIFLVIWNRQLCLVCFFVLEYDN